MTSRDRIVILVLVAAAAVAGFWFLVFEPKRAEATKLAKEVAAARQDLSSAQGVITAGESDRRNYPGNYATVARLGEAVPADTNEPSLVYQLNSAAGRAGVDFRSVKLTPSAASAPAPQTPPSGSKPGGSSTSSTPSSSAPTQAAASTLPPGASVGPAGFPTMPFVLGFDGKFGKMDDFFKRLYAFVNTSGHLAVSGRLLTIDGLSLTAGRHGFPEVKASVAATAYLVPDAQGATGGATTGGPAVPNSPKTPGGSTSPAAPATATPPVK